MSKTVRATMTKDAFHYEDLKNFKTTSAKVRYLDSLGFSRKEISMIVNIRYQHVRNILITPVAKARS